MTMNLKPAFRYSLRDYVSGIAVFLGVNLLLVLFSFVGAISFDSGSEFYYSGYGMGCAIFLLVCGIITPRASLRLCVQMGVSRRTAFLSFLISTLAASLVLAAAGDGLLAAAQHFGTGYSTLHFSDLYQLIYARMDSTLTLSQHMHSILFSTAVMLCCAAVGMFLSILFWRLNKIGCIIAGCSIPVLLIGLPSAVYRFRGPLSSLIDLLESLAEAFLRSPWNAILTFLVVSAVLTLISYLLIRRVNIRSGITK